MGASGGFPVELILFGMIAAFLVLRLRSILGRRQGFERQQAEPSARADVAPATRPVGRVIDVEPVAAASREAPDPATPAGAALARMRHIEPSFDPARFLAGAEGAFRMIVTAFALGHRDELRPLLSDEMYGAFDSAITAREQAGETQRTEIREIAKATIENAELVGNQALITVKFVSDQISLTTGRDGLPVAGADAVTELTDAWTFERQLGAADLTWKLVSARSA